MVSQVAAGLTAAHERHQVHRDLKPDNLFLCHTQDGDITKILDFGSVRDNSENAKKLTVMGTTIGSPFYMPPEQAQGLATLDHRADIWSLAAIVYECLTGKVPFAGSTGPAILLAILTQDPPPISEAGKDQGVPVTLDEVIETALAKNHEIRQPSIGAFADALGHAYGLTGDHHLWAKTPEAELTHQIAQNLPAKLAAYQARGPGAFPALDGAFGKGAFAGAGPTQPHNQLSPRPPGTLPDDLVIMGLPPERPAWFWPAIGGGAFFVVVLLAFLLTR
jgi:serine/threonine protein kinase